MEEPPHSEAVVNTGYFQFYTGDVEKNALLLTRLTRLFVDEELDYDNYKQICWKYSDRLQVSLEIMVPYIKMMEKEARYNKEELRHAHEKRELLETRKKVGDISEEEYRLKSAVVEWDINNLTEKQMNQNSSVNLESLSYHIQPQNQYEIRELITKAERVLTNMEYNSEPYEMVSHNLDLLKKIAPE